MSIVSWKRVKEIFHEAVDLPDSERERFMATACGDDDRLRAMVEELLASDQDAGEFLASPAIEVSGGHGSRASRAGPEAPGSRIGPYKLLQLIGEGGFGSVYMAEQEEPIRRQVALKIIKLGMDTKEVLARFEAERQALAMMDHPNIARVLDAGATESGRPYFVMELVRGVSITEYADSGRLSTRERLELFMDVCKAVDHAHTKGIVHRDIKPSNVMVTLHDGVPVPKVIDFGVAKATNHRLTEKTLFTRYGEFIGTPSYMSPEQAETSGLNVDHRSDVYSLGVLLYELLTGTTPFSNRNLRGVALVEVLRVLQQEDPPTPSSRLRTLGDKLDEVAKQRHTDPHTLSKLLRGDLDWIVMKAIEKDRRRRYDSASELGRDIARYFGHDPVIARKPSTSYRLLKFVKRRRGPVVAAASVLVALGLGGWLAMTGVLGPALEPAPPAQRLVVPEAGDYNAVAPTRDGRHLLRYDTERRGYELVEIESGRATLLTTNGPDPESRLFVDHDLSPDRQLIAAIHLTTSDVDGESDIISDGHAELRTIPVGGEGVGRLLFDWEPGHYVKVFGWSPDQEQIWVWVMRPDRSAEIGRVDRADGSFQAVKTLEGRTISQPPSLSPDGRFITYHDVDGREVPADIFLLASDGSREVRVEHPARDRKPLFTPDGSGVVFASNREGDDLWFLPVEEGRPAGQARPVWRDIGPYGQAEAFGENGSLFYFFATNGWELYSAELDLSGRRVGAVEHIPARNGEMNNAPAYSPDGGFLAHTRNGGRRLVLRELATGVEREFPIARRLRVPAIDFCPDGRSVLVSGFESEGVLFRVDLDRGAERLPIEGAGGAVCVGEDEIVYFQPSQDGGMSRIVRRSLRTGVETSLYEGPASNRDGPLERSPGGDQVAFVRLAEDEAQLVVMPSAGGEPLTVATSPIRQPRSWTEFSAFMWLPNGRELLVVRPANPDDPDFYLDPDPEIAFERVPLDGGPVDAVARMRLPRYEGAIRGARHYRMHPDGSRIVFDRNAGFIAQVWAIDNLLSFIRSGNSAVAVPGR